MAIIAPFNFQKPMWDLPTQDLALGVKSNLISFFFRLMGQGFIVSAPANLSVRNLIIECLGIPDAYLEERIQTLFLNGTVIDNLDSYIIKEGSTLALSGAMPGLAGAVLRRGGFYASFREQISHSDNQSRIEGNHLWIVVKLFNLIVRELGPAFLARGIWLEGEKLETFFQRHVEEFNLHGVTGHLNGEPIDLNYLLNVDWKKYLVNLQVKSEQATSSKRSN